ncbi:hypothetical protein [Xanthomonas phage NEB7]|nr:hypothetical protein [Xanthomonas phage NEB7]
MSTDLSDWVGAYTQAAYAIVDRDNKRAATADCIDRLGAVK